MEFIRGISGIRGIVGNGLDVQSVSVHAKAFANIQKDGIILVARDSRSHGAELLEAISNALSEIGRTVVNCDIIPTPTAQFMIEKRQYAGGIVITASHNPIQWNGMKFIDSDGCFLDSDKNNRLFQIADENKFGSSKLLGKIENDEDGLTEHIDHTSTLSVIDLPLIKSRQFKVVVDSVNGAASDALPRMLEKLGCDVEEIYCEPNGIFLRGAEPLPHNLEDLGNKVKQVNADVGFATDPDGDRLAVVDEKGNPLGEEYTLTICADAVLSKYDNSTPLVTNLSTTLALDKLAERYENSVIRSAVGEINVVNLMKEKKSVIGGEGNGGVIFPESHYGRDSLVGVTLFLQKMATTHQRVSEIFHSMPQFKMVKDKVELGEVDPDEAIAKIQKAFLDIEQNTLDGLKLTWSDRWVHIRKSNTEPIVRIYAEAPTKNDANKLVKTIKKCIL